MFNLLIEAMDLTERDDTYEVNYDKFMAHLEVAGSGMDYKESQLSTEDKKALCQKHGLLFGYEKSFVNDLACKLYSFSEISKAFAKSFKRPIDDDVIAIECLSFASKTILACQLNPTECFSNLERFKDYEKFQDRDYCVANTVIFHHHVMHCYCRKSFFTVNEETKDVTIILRYRVYPLFSLVAASRDTIFDIKISTTLLKSSDVDDIINSVFNSEKYSKEMIFILSSSLPCDDVTSFVEDHGIPIGLVFKRFGENLMILDHPVLCCNARSSEILAPATEVLHNWASFFDSQRCRKSERLDTFTSKSYMSYIADYLLSDFEKYPALLTHSE